MAKKDSEQFYNELKDTFMAIPEKDCRNMIMTQEDTIAESEMYFVIENEDFDKLTHAGLNPKYIKSLNARVGAFAYAAAQYELLLDDENEAAKIWKEKFPLGVELRRKLLVDLEFAYRKDDELKQRVEEIKEGRGNRDQILDLLASYIMAKEHPEPLQQINFDFSKAEEAKKLHDELEDAHARAILDKSKQPESMKIRDKAYTYLKEATDEIQEYRQYVFHDDPERYDLYLSDFRQKIGKLAAKKKKEEEEEQPIVE